MSNLDILEVALNNIRNKLTSFYSLVADIDNRLVNAENYLLDNGDTLNPILSNIDEGSIFTIYSEAIRNALEAIGDKIPGIIRICSFDPSMLGEEFEYQHSKKLCIFNNVNDETNDKSLHQS